MKNLVLAVILLFSISALAGQKGFKISAIEKGSIYQKLGLKNGDIVTKVNGIEPASIDDFSSWLSKTKAGDKVEVTVDRNGKPKTLHYTIK